MTADVKMLLSRKDDLDDLDYLVPLLRAKTTQRKVAKVERCGILRPNGISSQPRPRQVMTSVFIEYYSIHPIAFCRYGDLGYQARPCSKYVVFAIGGCYCQYFQNTLFVDILHK